ncbi:MAG: hypothetical protein ABTQ32_08710 [Myxococcaceae bacterium]
MRFRLLSCLLSLTFALPAFAQYSETAGMNSAPAARVVEQVRNDKTGKLETKERFVPVVRDSFGNSGGNQHDLAVDGAFDGQTVAVVQLYDFPFDAARDALKEKGFSVFRWNHAVPPAKEFEQQLSKACQLWIISSDTRRLSDEHIAVIKRFFDSGKGVYIWGDNQPYYADANAVGQALMGVTMQGDLMGDRVVGLEKSNGQQHVGIRRSHLLSTGLEFLYEGITIATVRKNEVLEPLLYGSAGNLVSGFYDRNGKRAIFDGGFTRLYNKWDTAGTARYVKNSAAWLVNAERFGDAVVSKRVKLTVPDTKQ